MRYVILLLLDVLVGCAHIERHDQETGLEVSYTGPANGAARLVLATDRRTYDLARGAIDRGMATGLARDADGDVRFSAGFGYPYGMTGSVGGYVPGNVGYVLGQGFVVGPLVSALPPLANTLVARESSFTTGSTVLCPTEREPSTPAEQASCALLTARTALEQSNE